MRDAEAGMQTPKTRISTPGVLVVSLPSAPLISLTLASIPGEKIDHTPDLAQVQWPFTQWHSGKDLAFYMLASVTKVQSLLQTSHRPLLEFRAKEFLCFSLKLSVISQAAIHLHSIACCPWFWELLCIWRLCQSPPPNWFTCLPFIIIFCSF